MRNNKTFLEQLKESDGSKYPFNCDMPNCNNMCKLPKDICSECISDLEK